MGEDFHKSFSSYFEKNNVLGANSTWKWKNETFQKDSKWQIRSKPISTSFYFFKGVSQKKFKYPAETTSSSSYFSWIWSKGSMF